MKKYGLNELREMFLAFFEEKGHLRLGSFPLIPQNDASLLLINSGMAPMKPWFTGEQEPPRRRVCTCQKCIRTGDIDNVGKTSRHGTFFEMLGNFSFGDYFKKEAITWCWEFLTRRLEIDPGLLYPSVYRDDEQAFDIWKNGIGVAPERIIKLGREDNFWDHGSGPCGPCSEVYFDRGEAAGCGRADCAPGCDCDRYVEIWNNVFTQYDNDGNGNYTDLSQKNIDTGLGLERLACVMQGVSSLFEVDTVISIINKISKISGAVYGGDSKTDVSLRVITDHIRSATMMICDGVLPSNEGRGYVLRRLLRRAAMHGRLLSLTDSFLFEISAEVVAQSKLAYPDLEEKAEYIARVIRAEEENFGRTIDSGTKILTDIIAEYKARGENTVSGADAFKLYDTYGFPLDLTMEIIDGYGMRVDTVSFNEQMESQKTRARKAREALGDLAWAGVDSGVETAPTVFIGYDEYEAECNLLAIITQNETSSFLREGQEGCLILDRTPFYAEQGGQCADNGTISCGGAVFNIKTVQKSAAGKYLHYGTVGSGELKVGDVVTAKIDRQRRKATARAHSATHLLQEALRRVLGSHVHQAGSLVEPDRFRFDFTHFQALTPDELVRSETVVNEAILEGLIITTEEMPIEEAKRRKATALFGEKYGDIVRVVRMGSDYSIELCAGTHLDNTAKAGAFSIESEFSIASGVRRIEATTGVATLGALNSSRSHLAALAAKLKAGSPQEMMEKFEKTSEELRGLRQKLDALLKKEAYTDASALLQKAAAVGGLKVIAAAREGADNDALRQTADALRDKEPHAAAVLAAVNDGKVTLMAVCGKEAIAKGVKAGDILKEVAKKCGGSGGGKPEFAMGGGKDPSKLQGALDSLPETVGQIVLK